MQNCSFKRNETRASLPFISNELATLISQQGLESALSQPLARILEQVQLALDNAQLKTGCHLPDRR